MNEKSKVEKIAGGLPANIAANTVGALGATITPLAAFVPFLVQTLASGRQSQRLEKMFDELSTILEDQAEKLQALTDAQYKLVNEAISAAFYTVDERKLELLKKAVVAAIAEPSITDSASDALSRLVRDISADEAKFMMSSYPKYLYLGPEERREDDAWVIRLASNEEILMSGLISLGLIYSKQPVYGPTRYEWSPLANKFIKLLISVAV